MAVAVVQSKTGTFSDGNTGHAITFDSTAASGHLLVLTIASDTVVTTPSGWTLPTNGSRVGGQGAYLFYKVSAGSETGVTVTTSGNLATTFSFVEYSGTAASPFDVATNVGVDGTGGTSTPSVTLTAGAAGELHVFVACLHILGGAATSPSWSNGVTQFLNSGFNSTSPGEQQFYGHVLAAAGTATTTVASWTTSAQDRYTIAAAFKPAAGGSSIDATASQTVTATISPTGVRAANTTASPTTTATISPASTVTANGSATRSTTATISPTGAVDANATATRSTTATISPTGAVDANATASRSVTASISPASAVDANATASVSVSASISATGTVGAAPIEAQASLTGTATISPTATLDANAAASPTVTATISPTVAAVANGTATLTSTATISPTATLDTSTTASLTATATISAAAAVTGPFTIGALSASSSRIGRLAAAFARGGPS